MVNGPDWLTWTASPFAFALVVANRHVNCCPLVVVLDGRSALSLFDFKLRSAKVAGRR